jgi:hypothetical protein
MSADATKPPLVGRAICDARGAHRCAVSGLTGLAYCLDCDYEEGD